MVRLPTPGGDAGNWGTILNEFLSQSHDSTGAIKTGSITSAHLAPGVLDGKVDTTAAIATAGSLTGGGNLTANRTLSLVGDAATPGASRYYGTDSSGTKGYHALPTAGGSTTEKSDQILLTKGGLFVQNNILPPGMVYIRGASLTRVDLVIGTPATGSGVTVTMTQGATTLATITLAANQMSATLTLATPATIAAMDPVQFNITAVGSTTTGADLLAVVTTT